MGVQEVADGGADDVFGGVQLGIEGVQEVVAVAWVELPRILAVERHDDQEVLVALLLVDVAQPAHEVARRVKRGHPVVVEPDQVGQDLVAEDHGDLFAFTLHSVRLVEELRREDPAGGVAAEVGLQRAGEHVLVGDEPLETSLGGEAGHALADRHLRRPHAGRAPAEEALECGQAEGDLLVRVLLVREPAVG